MVVRIRRVRTQAEEAARRGTFVAPPSTTCVIVSPPAPPGKLLPVAAALSKALTARGWSCLPLALNLQDGRASIAAESAAAAAACAEGAAVVVCPELETPVKGGLFGMGEVEFLAPVEPNQLSALLKNLEVF